MAKRIPLLLVLAAVSAGAADGPRLVEPTMYFRAGFDSNPTGTGGASAVVLGGNDSATYAAGAGFGLGWSAATTVKPTLKLTYAGEAVRFEREPGENFSTHRFGFSGQFIAGDWKFTGEGSSLFVAGADETLLSVATVNANAMTLWRERRRQWQHRLKLQMQREFGAFVLRGTGTLLAYDYRTQVVAGRVAFTDRADAQGAIDLGWKQNASSLWLTGVRVGHQEQAIVPLPNCEFDYSNDYLRLAAGWEGKPFANTTVGFAAGPDFRRYTGAIDRRVFFGGRDRTSLWCEGNFSSKLSPSLTLTGKVVRMDWLSSTGKSAYIDTCAEAALSWTVDSRWTLRTTGKLHRCDYFPVVRDDWEALVGAGASFKLSARTAITADVLRHRGWNNVAGVSDREFGRTVVSVGATLKL